MNSTEFVKYVGLDQKLKITTPYFKRLSCSDTFVLAPDVPDLQDLMTVTAKATLTTAELLHIGDTYKALISGHIHLSFQYATPDPRFALYFGDHHLHFSEYMTLPSDLPPTIHLYPSVAIEDIFSYATSSRTLYHHVLMLILIQLG